MRDGIVIGVLLDHFTAKLRSLSSRPRGRQPSIFFTAVIYPVVKVHRRSGSPAGSLAPCGPSVPLVGGLCGRAHGSGDLAFRILTRVDGSEDLPANRRLPDGGGVGSRASGGPEIFACLVSLGARRRSEGGGDEETRTPDPLLAKEMLFQLSYVPVLCVIRGVVGAPGLEPGTSALSGPRSNQLSYAPRVPA